MVEKKCHFEKISSIDGAAVASPPPVSPAGFIRFSQQYLFSEMLIPFVGIMLKTKYNGFSF